MRRSASPSGRWPRPRSGTRASREQISEVLLVGGSSRMPAVSEALQQGVRLGAQAHRPRPGRGQGRGPVRGGPDRALRRTRTADGGQRPRASPARPDGGMAAPGPVTDEAVRAVADQTGLDEEQVRGPGPADGGQRAAEGDRHQAGGHRPSRAGRQTSSPPSTSSTWWTRRPSFPFPGRTFVASTVTARPGARSRSRSGSRPGASPGRELSRQPPGRRSGRITGLGPFALPAGIAHQHRDQGGRRGDSPPAGGGAGQQPARSRCTVRISILSEEQVAEAKVAHAGLTVST